MFKRKQLLKKEIAVGEDFYKQARKMRTNWIKNKQAANGLLSGPSGGCPRRLAPRTGPSTLHVRIM